MRQRQPHSVIGRAADADECLRIFVESSFEGLAISVDGVIVAANEALAQLTGYTRAELAGMGTRELATSESALRALEHIRDGLEVPYELIGVRKDGSLLPFDVRGRNVRYFDRVARLTAFRDSSERKRGESERKRSEARTLVARKLETLGMLAGGVAHDFNNLLLVIVGHTELAARAAQEMQVQSSLRQIKAATQRASDLTKQLLTYAARRIPNFIALQLDVLLRETCESLQASLPSRARLELELSDTLPAIDADPLHLKQLVNNLVDNAGDALGETGGQILLRTAMVHADAQQLAQAYVDATPGPGDFVMLEISDGGSGMDEPTLERSFDPFFSTKLSARGLGLAVVLGIVRSHRGALFVASEPGHGSRFSLLFPRARRRSSAPPLPAAPAPAEADLHVAGRALLIGGDDTARERGCELLERFGLDVLLAAEGTQALTIFRARSAELDLVLLDLTLPHMQGSEVLRALRELRPEIPVIVLRDFGEQSSIPSDENTRFLAKPFDSLTLGDCIRWLLRPAACA
jgi:PAS domain S-box-containing protein